MAYKSSSRALSTACSFGAKSRSVVIDLCDSWHFLMLMSTSMSMLMSLVVDMAPGLFATFGLVIDPGQGRGVGKKGFSLGLPALELPANCWTLIGRRYEYFHGFH